MYDIIVIGAGPGGYETAVEAAKCDLQVLVAEASHVGGTCLNEGCIPTKSFCRNAEVLEDIRHAGDFGICVPEVSLDFAKVVQRKNEVVEQLRSGVASLLRHKNITFVEGRAELIDGHSIRLNGELYEGRSIIVATGSVPASLPIPGADLEGVITSKEILELEEVPERLCVIGAGVIGLEFASVFNTFGSKVSVIEYCKDILPRFDTDLAKRLKQSLGKKGIDITTQAQVLRIERTDEGLKVVYMKKDKEEALVADKVLMAVGRRANLASLDFEAAGIATDRRGVCVNEHMQTSVPSVYAVGDINGRMMLAHAATFQGQLALSHILGKSSQVRLDIMPAAVFTRPEVATVGLTEDECKEKAIEVNCLKSFFRANGKAVSMAEADGYCKLITAKADGKILGCHMFGAHSADIIQEVCALMNRDACLEDFKAIIHAHPSLCEVLQAAAHN